jgi:hypothetical protein
MEMTPRRTDSPEILLQLRWVAKIALWVGAIAAAGLAIMLYVLTDTAGVSYGDLIKSNSAAQHHLGPSLLIGGFFLLGFTAVLTWMIALYSTFRVAGPLFRLTRNLEASISSGPGKPVPIRDSDGLRQEAALLEKSLAVLEAHYNELRADIDQALKSLDAGELSPNDRLALSERLKKKLERARL